MSHSMLQFPEFKSSVSEKFPKGLFGSCQCKIVSEKHGSSVYSATFGDHIGSRFVVRVRVFSLIEDQCWFICFEDGTILDAKNLDKLMESVMDYIKAIADELVED